VNDNVPEPGRHGWAELLTLVGDIHRIAYLPSRSMTCEGQMSRILDLFHDYDHPEDDPRR
jgi:hypothetical protein